VTTGATRGRHCVHTPHLRSELTERGWNPELSTFCFCHITDSSCCGTRPGSMHMADNLIFRLNHEDDPPLKQCAACVMPCHSLAHCTKPRTRLDRAQSLKMRNSSKQASVITLPSSNTLHASRPHHGFQYSRLQGQSGSSSQACGAWITLPVSTLSCTR
jgi:hypothetical protein